MDMAAKFTKPWDCKNDYLSHLTRCHLLIRIMDSLLDDKIQHSKLNDALKELDIQIVRYKMRRSICDQVIKWRCYFLRKLYMVCDDGQKWPKKYFHWPFITVKCCLSNFWTNCAILCKVGEIRFYVTSLRKWRLLLHVLMVFSKHCGGGGDGDKFAYLTTKNSSFARAFFIFVHFSAILVLSKTWNNLFCSRVDDLSTWRQTAYFAHQATWNNWKLIAETQSFIFRLRSLCRRRLACKSYLIFPVTRVAR